MAPANRLRGWKAGHADGAVFNRKHGTAARRASKAGAHDEDRSFARDLNLDQIVAAIAGDREERDLIRSVLFGRLYDADAVRYRQEVFQDLENPALFGEVESFSELIGEVRAHLRQSAKMQDRYQRGAWLLDAAAIYCGAVRSLAGHLASAQISSPALLAFRDYLASYAASAEFTVLTADTRNRKEALGQIRYCTRIRTKLLTKITQLDALCVYVTFVDDLASLGEQVVSMMSTIVPDHPAERAYKVVRKPADGLAYALALAEKYGLTYERLHARVTA